jgi:hypothetical protein
MSTPYLNITRKTGGTTIFATTLLSISFTWALIYAATTWAYDLLIAICSKFTLFFSDRDANRWVHTTCQVVASQVHVFCQIIDEQE